METHFSIRETSNPKLVQHRSPLFLKGKSILILLFIEATSRYIHDTFVQAAEFNGGKRRRAAGVLEA